MYRIPVQARAAAGQRVFIETPKFGAACVRVTSAKGATQVLGWKPYKADITGETGTVAVSTMLTGQNAFGSSGGGRGGFGGMAPRAGAPGTAGDAARGAAAGGGQAPPAGIAGAPAGQGRGGAAQIPGVPNFAPAGLLEAPVITVMQAGIK